MLAGRLLWPGPLMADVEWSHGFSFGLTAAPLYTSTALQRAANTFLDVPLVDGGSGSGSGSGSSFGRNLSRYRVEPGPQVGVWIGLRSYLSPQIRLKGSLAWQASQTSVTFPDGIDVFTDPARARLFGQSLRGDLALDWGRAWQKSLGFGLEFSLVRAHVTSALLDVRAVTRTVQPFVLVGLGHDLSGSSRFTADLRFNKDNADLSVGIVTRF